MSKTLLLYAIAMIIACGPANAQINEFDVNKDNQVNTADVVAIYTYIIKGHNEAPKAYLTCPDNNHPHMIDLGLPSGTLWACCNVGASQPEDYGNYFAWGETSGKSIYNANTYTYYNSYSGFVNIGSDIAGTVYDVARERWGVKWQMPDYTQIHELVDNVRAYNVTGKWTTSRGVYGIELKGANGGRIFIPASGSRLDGQILSQGSWGYFWSSKYHQGSYSYFVKFSDNRFDWDVDTRSKGYPVRPVAK